MRQPKPDASYASTRQTRRNGPDQPLLSTFRKPRDDEPRTKPDPEPEPELNPEPATDAEPMSSSDEEDHASPSSDEEFKREKRVAGTTFDEKVAKKDEENAARRSSRSNGRGPQKRSISGVKSDREEDDDGPFSSILRSSQSQTLKRHKTAIYPSKNRLPSYARAPSSSARSTATSSPEIANRKNKLWADKDKAAETDAPSEPEELEPAFKVPMDIDISSSRRPRVRKSVKPPPTFPADSVSSTTSSKEPQTIFFDDDEYSSGLSSPLSELPSELDELDERDNREPSPRKWLCPLCKEEVDPGLLLEFEERPKQGFRQQQQFCRSHKQLSAGKEWEAHGYPEINWDGFEGRIQQHFSHLERILELRCSSYFRNRLESDRKAGTAKNLLSGDRLENMSCGYYGTKGSEKM